ncbi:hypothetical protein V6N13_086249 [Hibiscus sabdariffa]|uniref:Uncharacterized protein n=1 Tax=Hibiscus sabdariffa TaxID=183260 RepID=A0ABR2FSM1_9ROSI
MIYLIFPLCRQIIVSGKGYKNAESKDEGPLQMLAAETSKPSARAMEMAIFSFMREVHGSSAEKNLPRNRTITVWTELFIERGRSVWLFLARVVAWLRASAVMFVAFWAFVCFLCFILLSSTRFLNGRQALVESS